MLTVDYPAKMSYFHDKNAIIRTYGRWTTLKTFFTRPCYPYPVVYTDGLLSYVVSDRDGRTPWGIAIGDYIFAIHAPEMEMPLSEAREFCKTIVFADKRAEFMEIEVLRYIRRNIGLFNKLLKELGGTPFYPGVFPSATVYDKAPSGIDFSAGPSAFQVLNDEKLVYCRPAINISNLY